MSSVILDFLDKSEGKKEPRKKVVKQVEFGVNHYRSILQNRVIHHQQKGNKDIVKELMKLLSAVSTFGRDVKNIPRDIIDFVIIKRGQTYQEVFEPLEGRTRPNQSKESSYTRKLIAFFLYRYTKISMEGIAEHYIKQSERNVKYMVKEISEQINSDIPPEELFEIDSSIYDYLTTLYPKTKKNIKDI